MSAERLSSPRPAVTQPDMVGEAPANTETQQAGPSQSFEEITSAFHDAAHAAGGVIDHSYVVADFPIRLRFAGPALVPKFTPAFAHLSASAPVEPALTVCLWDSASTNRVLPTIPWADRDAARGGSGGDNTGRRFRMAFQPMIRFDELARKAPPLEPALSMLDVQRNLALYWTRDAQEVPDYECGAPIRFILHWWMGGRGLQLVHGGGVGTPAGGVLIVGKSGSGKSTAALACLRSALCYAGDDHALIGAEPWPCLHSVYNTGKLDPRHLDRFPHLGPAIWNADRLDTEKAVLFVHQHYPRKTSAGFPLRAVLVPNVGKQPETRIVEVSAAAALAALAPSTIYGLPGGSRAAFDTMARVLRQVPSYVLTLGSDISGIAPVISDLLSQIEGQSAP